MPPSHFIVTYVRLTIEQFYEKRYNGYQRYYHFGMTQRKNEKQNGVIDRKILRGAINKADAVEHRLRGSSIVDEYFHRCR